MRFKKINVDNVLIGNQKVEVCMELEVVIGKHTYKVGERNGKLHIRVDGGLFIEPIANNCISLSETV